MIGLDRKLSTERMKAPDGGERAPFFRSMTLEETGGNVLPRTKGIGGDPRRFKGARHVSTEFPNPMDRHADRI